MRTMLSSLSKSELRERLRELGLADSGRSEEQMNEPIGRLRILDGPRALG